MYRGRSCSGLIGHPIGHSWSPVMQEAAFAAAGIDARYLLWDTQPEQLAERIASLRSAGILGANITIPYKSDVGPLLDATTSGVLYSMGAVNTIVRQETATGIRLIGHNTDVTALQRVLREKHAWSHGKRLMVLGAGGAAQAAIAVALEEGAEPWIVARTPAAGHKLLALFAEWQQGPGWLGSTGRPEWRDHTTDHVIDLADMSALGRALSKTHVLVHATPIGTRDPTATPLPLQLLEQLPYDAFVLDMVYNPPVTALVRKALASGLRAHGGLDMLLYQGAEAFSLWTGLQAPLDQMRAALQRQQLQL